MINTKNYSYLFAFLLLLISKVTIGQQKHADYTQEIPAVSVKFQMKAIPGGKFKMGSEKSESGHNPDEGPIHEVTVSPFWMSTREVTWDMYELFVYQDFDQTKSLGVDAITRPSKPYLDMTF